MDLIQWFVVMGGLCLGVLLQWYIIRSAVKRAIKESFEEMKKGDIKLKEVI